jgi:hypothetical protein
VNTATQPESTTNQADVTCEERVQRVSRRIATPPTSRHCQGLICVGWRERVVVVVDVDVEVEVEYTMKGEYLA